MNDTELDRLLNSWETPAPSPALRTAIQGRFPRAERRFRFPLRWVLAATVLSITLAIATGQNASSFDQFFAGFRHSPVQAVLLWLFHPDVYEAQATFARIRQTEVKVSVDDVLVPSPQFGLWHATSMWIEVPGDGVYFFSTYSKYQELSIAVGRIHGNVLEFPAGAKHVRIECSARIAAKDGPVFVIRKQ